MDAERKRERRESAWPCSAGRRHLACGWLLVLAAALPAAVAAPLDAPAEVADGSPATAGVSLELEAVPVRALLQWLAAETGQGLALSDSVQGTLTLRLVDEPWDRVLATVLAAAGLDSRQEGAVLHVAPPAEFTRLDRERGEARLARENAGGLALETLRLNYHSAVELQKMLGGMPGGGGSGGEGGGFLSPRGRLAADARTNTLLVVDVPARLAALRSLVQALDRPVDQVLIEGRIVVASENFARDIGARFGVQALRQGDRGQAASASLAGNRALLEGGIGSASAPNASLPAGGLVSQAPAALAYTLLGRHFNLDLELSALQEEGRGEVISRPRLVTANQREGVIKQGREIGYMTLSGSLEGEGRVVPNVQFKEVVLELRVTPTITRDGRVFIDMAVKKDEVDRYLELAGYGSVPSINRREVTTSVLVEDGQTVVVGGVYEFADRHSLARVPLLADVPFLGRFFRKQGRARDKAELLVFITPHILRVAAEENGAEAAMPSRDGAVAAGEG